MNRNDRRRMGLSKEGADAMDRLNAPCTIQEVVKLSRGVAEDVLEDYQKRNGALQIAISIQMEILKEAVIKAGIISEEEFRKTYIKRAEEFNKMQLGESGDDTNDEETPEETNPTMSVRANDIEVQVKE